MSRYTLKLDIGKVMLSGYDADGFIGVQHDAYGDQKSGATPFELLHPFGFISRPRDPDSDGVGCTLLYAYRGSQGFAWLQNDPRVHSQLPQVKADGSSQYCATGAFGNLDGETGGYTLYVPYAFVDGVATKAMCISVSADQREREGLSSSQAARDDRNSCLARFC